MEPHGTTRSGAWSHACMAAHALLTAQIPPWAWWFHGGPCRQRIARDHDHCSCGSMNAWSNMYPAHAVLFRFSAARVWGLLLFTVCSPVNWRMTTPEHCLSLPLNNVWSVLIFKALDSPLTSQHHIYLTPPLQKQSIFDPYGMFDGSGTHGLPTM